MRRGGGGGGGGYAGRGHYGGGFGASSYGGAYGGGQGGYGGGQGGYQGGYGGPQGGYGGAQGGYGAYGGYGGGYERGGDARYGGYGDYVAAPGRSDCGAAPPGLDYYDNYRGGQADYAADGMALSELKYLVSGCCNVCFVYIYMSLLVDVARLPLTLCQVLQLGGRIEARIL